MKFKHVGFLALGLSAYTFANAQEAAPTPSATAPDPLRQVLLRPVGKSRVFTLPDLGQTQVDLSTDLDTLFSTEVVNSSHLKPMSAVSPTPVSDSNAAAAAPDCTQHLELEADLTALSLNNQEYKVTIGYNSSGTINPGNALNATGTVDFKIGSLRMDFHLYSCSGTECVELLASSAGSNLTGLSTDIQINFGMLGAGFSMMWDTNLHTLLSAIMDQGVQALVSSPDFENLLPWQAQVYQVDPQSGTVSFNAGSGALLGPNQAFTVLEPMQGMSGGCPIYKSVAEIHTVHVEDSATAVVDSWFDGAQTRGIQTGDTVMVREVK